MARFRPHALALLAGSLGGGIFAAFGMPLAWMLGAMMATMVLALSGQPLAVGQSIRVPMVAVLGVLLGSSFTLQVLISMTRWLPAIMALLVLVVLCTLIGWIIFRHILKFDPVTAYFSSVPGGLTEMALMGDHYGGSPALIGLAHVVRIMLVVSVVPLYFRFVGGVEMPSLPPGASSLLDFAMADAAVLGLCALLGVPLAWRLKLPAGLVMGPMILSAIVHIAGWSTAPPPAELVAAAQVVVGATIGSRFSGLTLGQLRQVALGSLVSAALMIGLAASCAWLLAPWVDQSTQSLFIAFSPGGVTEMSLVALSLDQDPAFVTTFHLLRILSIITFAVPVFAWSRRSS